MKNNLISNFIGHILVKDDKYDKYEEQYQAQTMGEKFFYLFAYLLPGILAYILLNIKTVYDFLINIFGIDGYDFQYAMFLVFTFGWHIVFPLLMLRKKEKLTWQQIREYLSLDRFSLKEVFWVAPVAFLMSVLLSLPYMLYVYGPFQDWLNSIPFLRIPEYSIFASYEAFYGASTLILGLMLIGNFVGEEIYFRGYLMKKTAFLGKYNWFINSFLFCIYHLWQVPQSLPLLVPFLFFGLVMQLRKNLYTLVVFHLLFNLAGVEIYNVLLGL